MSTHLLHTLSATRCGIAPQSFRRGMEGKGMEEEWSKNPGRSPQPSSLSEGLGSHRWMAHFVRCNEAR